MDRLNIASPITRTATSTYSGSVVSLPIARSQNSQEVGGVAIIKEGWAAVKEGKSFLKQWNNRYMVLRKEKLDFHKTETSKVTYCISLKDVVGVSRVEAAGVIFEIKRHADGRDSSAPGDDDGNNTKTLQIKVRTDEDLYEWIDFIYARCPGMGGVSNPTNFAHAVHVGFDPNTGEFVGLPPEWSKLLNSSAITKEDYERNPQAVFEVLEFYSDINKRQENPEQYSSLMPTPPATSENSKQLGYMGGSSIAPPRLAGAARQENNVSNSGPQRIPTPPEQAQQLARMREMASQYKPNPVSGVNREEQRQKDQEVQRQREQEERERKEMAEYNASLPKTRTPLAQQEIGGGGYSASPSNDRYNPTRAAPPRPGQQQQGTAPAPLRAQRQAPPAPTSGQRQPMSSQPAHGMHNENVRAESPRGEPRDAQRVPNGQSSAAQSSSRAPNGQQQQRLQPPAQAPKPLNVAKPSNAGSSNAGPSIAGSSNGGTSNGGPSNGGAVNNGIQQTDAVRAAEAALTAKTPAAERKQDVRMSTMSENEVMARLRAAVSKDDPTLSYSKQKKIGQGASGSVYVAKVKENPVSPVARQVLRDQGMKAQVAIKQMDLAHQPRKELIVNEIMVMKDSKHKNIVNFLDAFLRNNSSELWVIMEFMEGGPLTDVIDNNPVITEEQISTICLETCQGLEHLHRQNIIHRDIKSDNVLLDARGNVKISKQILSPA